MRIIDSQKDFYDFYQNIYLDDKYVFDRRDSYNLTKEEFASNFYYRKNEHKWHHETVEDKTRFVLLQICNTFWLFKLIIKATSEFNQCTDYDLELVSSWKDYTYNPELIKLSHISFSYHIKKDDSKRIDAILHKEHKEEKCFNQFHIYTTKGNELIDNVRTIPILQNIGIASLVDPLDIYLALEEYFSLQEANKERTESVGLTNDEKITNHGFNMKDSFRGK